VADFNILHDGWIQVELINGETDKLGAFDCLLKAHEIKRLIPYRGDRMTEVGYLRFLHLFVYDIYRPKSDDLNGNALEAILESGKFDKSMLESYISELESEGVCFNLLDDKKPFLQCAEDDFDLDENELASKMKPSGIVNKTNPKEGNDVLFGFYDTEKYKKYYNVSPWVGFDYNKKNAYIDCLDVTYDEYATYLILDMFYRGASGGDIACSQLGNTTEMLVVRGKNLFETLLFNMVSTDIDYSGKPFYRNSYKDAIKEMIWVGDGNYRIFSCYMTPCNFVRWAKIDEERKVITDIYFKRSKEFIEPCMKEKLCIDSECGSKDFKAKSKDFKAAVKNYHKINDPMTIKFFNGKTTNVLTADENAWLKMYEYLGLSTSDKSNALLENIDIIGNNISFSVYGYIVKNTSVIKEEISYDFEVTKNIFSKENKNNVKNILMFIGSIVKGVSEKDSGKIDKKVKKDIAISIPQRITKVRYLDRKDLDSKRIREMAEYEVFSKTFLKRCENKFMHTENSWISMISNGCDIDDIYEEIYQIAKDVITLSLRSIDRRVKNVNQIKDIYATLFTLMKYWKEEYK